MICRMKVDPLFEDVSKCRRLVDKFIYLTVKRPDIAYVIGLMSQFMHKPRKIHQKDALRILTYTKGSPGKSLL